MTFTGKLDGRPIVKGFAALELAKRWEREQGASGVITRDCDGVALTNPAKAKLSPYNGLN